LLTIATKRVVRWVCTHTHSAQLLRIFMRDKWTGCVAISQLT
jgi:hypothetical protein